MDYTPQLNEALTKDVETIAFLSFFPIAKLEGKLSSLKRQKVVASRNARYDALELLTLWETQANDALTLKRELGCEDNYALDLDMFLPEIETLEMMEKRQQVLEQKLGKTAVTKAYLPN